MICKKCAKGADVASGKTIVLIEFKPDSRPVAEIAKSLHAACKGSTWCDCQHRTKITS